MSVKWKKAWRDARVLANQGREPSRKLRPESMVWVAFEIATNHRGGPNCDPLAYSNAWQRLWVRRNGDAIPF